MLLAAAAILLFASHYVAHLENWLAHFDDIYFLSYKALQEERDKSLRNLCAFLELPYNPVKKSFHFPQIFMNLRNVRRSEASLSPADEVWLREQFHGEVERLERLVGDLSIFD